VRSYPGKGLGMFAPRPEINRTDAEISLLFLDPGTTLYVNQTNDPWFEATTPTYVATPVSNRSLYYQPDEPVGVLACTWQSWFCNPNLPDTPSRCISVDASYESPAKRISSLWPKAQDAAAISGFIASFFDTRPDSFYSTKMSLLTSFTLTGSYQLDAIFSNR
jgi:hypothetical protein